jgi:hypothetical protein
VVGPDPVWSTGKESMTTREEPPHDSPVRFARLRNFRTPVLSRLSIQSKLLIMLLVTSILSAAVVGFIGYQSGRSSLRAAVFDALTEIRGSQSRQLEAQFSDLTSSLIVYTRGATTSEALAAFTPAFDQLADAAISPQQQQSVRPDSSSTAGR